MSEANSDGDVTEREEVAPELVMEMIRTHEPDGRYLIYYNFRTAAAQGGPAADAAAAGADSAKAPADR